MNNELQCNSKDVSRVCADARVNKATVSAVTQKIIHTMYVYYNDNKIITQRYVIIVNNYSANLYIYLHYFCCYFRVHTY